MRAVIQRVSSAGVEIRGAGGARLAGAIGAGLLVLVAVENGDTGADANWLASKIVSLRVFEDESGKMNLSVADVGGDILAVSQFTLYGNVKKGNRPSFNRSAPPAAAVPLYEKFLSALEALLGKPVARGEFGAMMDVRLVNDGPITIIIDTKARDI